MLMAARAFRGSFQIASNVRGRKNLIRPNAATLVLAGGSGSLNREETFHFYNWVGREFDNVYTLLNDADAYAFYKGVLPENVHSLNHVVHRLGTTDLLITGNGNHSRTADIAVFRGYPRRQQIEYAHTTIFQKGVDWSAKNGVVCLANDGRHLLFDPARVIHVQ